MFQRLIFLAPRQGGYRERVFEFEIEYITKFYSLAQINTHKPIVSCQKKLNVINVCLCCPLFQVKILATKGGGNVKEATRSVMSAFFSNNLLVDLNWTGQGGKMAFGKLKSAEIVRSKYAKANVLIWKFILFAFLLKIV